MNKIVLIIAIIIVSGGGWFYMNQQSANTTPTTESGAPVNTDMGVSNPMPVPSQDGSRVTQPETVVTQEKRVTTNIKEFTITGTNFVFSPNTISVNKGDTVKINFKNADGFHDFRIDGYNVGTQKVQTGGIESFQFVADKSGSFEYFCSVGSHRANGMKGTLTVK